MAAGDEDHERAVARAAGAVKKPWLAALVFAGVVGTAIAARALGGPRGEVAPLLGLPAGLLLSIGLSGYSPGMYPDPPTGQYAVFWSERTTRGRVVCALVAIGLVAIGVAFDRLWP